MLPQRDKNSVFHIDIKLSPHHLLKWPSFHYCTIILSLSQTNYIYRCCCCCCSVAKSCPTLCSPMDCSITGSPVFQYLPELAQIHIHWVSESILTLPASVIPFSSCLQCFPAPGSFPMSQLFASGGQSIGASASLSVLAMNIQDWFPLGLTGWISLKSKGPSRVFCQHHSSKASILRCSAFFMVQLSNP